MTLVRSLDTQQPITAIDSSDIIPISKFVMMLAAALILGVLGGFVLGHVKGSAKTDASKSVMGNSNNGVANSAGIADKKTFKDEAEGDLKEGGIEGEGSFHLVRPGGTSQYVYLTSSTVDLSKFVGKKVKVHGVTMAGQKAGWLMDVGYVELP